MPTAKYLQKMQRGKETTRGTAVPATARWLGNMTVREADKYYVPDYPYGVLSQYYNIPTRVAKFAEISYASDLTVEEIVDFLLMSLKGGVTPGAPNYTWTFTHAVTADPAPTTFTLEFANTDGSNTYGREMEYVFCPKFGINAGIDEPMKFTADLVGRQVTDSTPTAGLSLPTNWHVLQSNALKVYLDSAWANLGTTQLSGKVVDMALEVNSGLSAGKYLSGNLYFDAYKAAALLADLKMTIEFDSTADTEQENKRTATRRFIRLESIDAATSYKVRVDLCCFHAEDSIQEMFGDRDGSDTVSFHLLSAYDPTAAKDLEVVVLNGLSAIP